MSNFVVLFKSASPLRKALMGLGGASFVAGVTLLAFGTLGWLSGGDADGTDVPFVDLPSVTAKPSPTPGSTFGQAPATPTPVPIPPLGDRPYTMIIDKLGVNNPVEAYGLDSDQVPEVPTEANSSDPANVVAWYEFSAKPGVGSNAVFAGHVTWFGPGVFFRLTSVAAGDEIKLLGDDGTLLTYAVTEIFQVDATDPDALSVMHATDTDTLTIITCDGDFVDTDDPVFGGEYNLRLVVRAALQSVALPGQVASGA